MPEWFLRGGFMMWPLLACSVLALGIVIERAWFWWRERRSRKPLVIHKLLHLTERGLFNEAAACAAEAPGDTVARVLRNGLTHHHFSMENALAVAAQAELRRMRQFLSALDTIVTVAPLMGILGTVIGILVAFRSLEGMVPDPAVVAAGIAQAVITTAAGLSIAIPAVIAYNAFAARFEETAERLDAQMINFRILHQKGLRRRGKSTSVDAEAGQRALSANEAALAP